MKKDVFNHEQRYLNWKKKIENSDIKGVSKKNSDIIKRYIFDMERGLNISVASKRGARSYPRLNNLKQRINSLAVMMESRLKVNIEDLTEEQLFSFFGDMRTGEIRTQKGEIYKSTGDYVKVFRAFWRWHIKSSKKLGKTILDITADLDGSSDKPRWVYLTQEQIKKLCDNSLFRYKVLIMFLYDTGLRSPSELFNIKVNDLFNDCKELNVREEISKTFGRRMKLMISSQLIKDYIKENNLKDNDYLFPLSYAVTNRYLQRLAKKLFGEGMSEAGKRFSELTMYDFRHCSSCYWLPRYKSEAALKYRFGWKKSERIHYYSEFLGMKDTIEEGDLLIDVTKTEIEKRLAETEKKNDILEDKLDFLEKKLSEIGRFTDILFEQFSKKKIEQNS